MTESLYKRIENPKEYVMAFVFGEGSPEWFEKSNRISIFQRLIYEDGKTMSFLPGDYVCRNLEGNIWVENKEDFLNKFRLIEK